MKDKAEGTPTACVPLTDAEFTMSVEEWAEAFAEDPSCIYTYLRAAEARGRAEVIGLLDAEAATQTGYGDLGDYAEDLAAQARAFEGNAPEAPTDSLLQVTPEEPETNQQRAGTPRTPEDAP